MTKPTVGVVLLSMGNRPEELAHALEGLAQQRDVELDVLLLGNGWVPEGVPDWVRTEHSAENLGCPGGRNAGAPMTRGEFLFFYDDDGYLPDPNTLSEMVKRFAYDDVAVVQGRGVDPTGKPSPRRWVPRLRKSAELRAGDVAVFWEAMAMFRRSAFDEVGGWCGELFFGHEGTDIAMRLIDRGWRIRYEPDIVVQHPATPAGRHSHHFFTTMRNRVWVARRNIPGPLLPLYLGIWLGATLVRARNADAVRHVLRGFREGWATRAPGGRHPISWSTVVRMAKLGRPPLW
ncbi:glycosyltransferase family 2 protein [Tessaracoccus oleiagri]|uniref:Glycosyltransferase, GT2 family n=1 Tax=Tessaracoccus oleiagri TaxID=686624 RepID=A0A1G9HG28_9ACTN|nr:glycosyltransferase [Tessaracoccus oleiagri]SDL11433.1 Glycosyltransferase, GT2 family [Tessaracoccus oleiagri]